MTGRAYMVEVLNQVWLEMSESLDKQVNAQKENLKKLPGFTQAPVSPQKVCDENKKTQRNRKNGTHIKMLFMEGSPL